MARTDATTRREGEFGETAKIISKGIHQNKTSPKKQLQ
jgi:hypothetical protein